jgi:hypothetical protein
VHDTGIDGGIDLPRAIVCRERCVHQPANPARVDERRVNLGVASIPRPGDQASQRLVGSAAIDVDLRKQMMCDRQVGIEPQRLVQRLFGARQVPIRILSMILGDLARPSSG